MDLLITAAARTEHPMLTRDNRNAVGGMVKRVVASQIRPLLQQQQIDHANIITLKQEIAAFKAVPVAERPVRGGPGLLADAGNPEGGGRWASGAAVIGPVLHCLDAEMVHPDRAG